MNLSALARLLLEQKFMTPSPREMTTPTHVAIEPQSVGCDKRPIHQSELYA